VQFLELQKLCDLGFDLGLGQSQTGVHIWLRSTHTLNKIKIQQNFWGRTDENTDRPEFQFTRSLPSNHRWAM